MKIIIEFEDRYAVVLIGLLTIVGWVFSYSLVYTTYYLSTGQDPLSWLQSSLPPEVYGFLLFLGQNGGYVSVISGMILFTIFSVLIIKRQKKKR